MNAELVEHMLGVHDARLNDHSKRLDKIEIVQAESGQMIKSLCEKVEGLTKAIYWLIGLGATGLLGFFFYAIQNTIFK